MSRKARGAAGGVVYHVLNRAVARIRIFRHEKDYAAFVQVLTEAHARLPVPILAYCVMPNHWHLVLYPRHDGELSQFMYWLTLTHAQRWRTSHETIGYGPLYQGRFRSFPVQDDAHLMTVLRYVERNPLRRGLVKRAEDWQWSSLHRRVHGTVEQRALLSEWPIRVPDDWLEWVNGAQTAAEEEDMRISIYRSRPYGDGAWQQQIASELGLASCFRCVGRPEKKRVR